MIGIFLFLLSITIIYIVSEFIKDQPTLSSNGEVQVEVQIPVKTSELYARNQLLAGITYYYDVRVTMTNLLDQPLDNFTINIIVPSILGLNDLVFSPVDLNVSMNSLYLNKSSISARGVVTIDFKIMTPASIPFSTSENIQVYVEYTVDSQTKNFPCKHVFYINPLPSWITYVTIILGIVILVSIIFVAKKTDMLEKYSTIDLVNITVLSSLGAIVFKWIWQMFNDFLGIFGGLLLTIPASLLMVITILLVKKPGTATIFFVVWELVNFFVWGSNIASWFGWYLMEGVIVDGFIMIFRDYAEKWYTASFYGMIRCFIAYWTTYFWFSPAVWRVYYAPWYAWLQVMMGCIGGIIGGILGYYTGKRLQEAIVIQ